MDTNGNHPNVAVDGDAVIFKLSQQIASLVTQLAMKDAALDAALNKVAELESGQQSVKQTLS